MQAMFGRPTYLQQVSSPQVRAELLLQLLCSTAGLKYIFFKNQPSDRGGSSLARHVKPFELHRIFDVEKYY